MVASRSSPIAPLSTHRTLAGITDPIDIFFFTDDSTDNQYSDRMHANMSTVSRSTEHGRGVVLETFIFLFLDDVNMHR